MFKETNDSEMSKSKFGVGSIIERDWLVVGVGGDHVSVVSLVTFRTKNKSVSIKDINHFTRSEFAAVCEIVEPQWTTSDFTGDPEGIKR